MFACAAGAAYGDMTGQSSNLHPVLCGLYKPLFWQAIFSIYLYLLDEKQNQPQKGYRRAHASVPLKSPIILVMSSETPASSHISKTWAPMFNVLPCVSLFQTLGIILCRLIAVFRRSLIRWPSHLRQPLPCLYKSFLFHRKRFLSLQTHSLAPY